MKDKNIDSLEDLIKLAQDNGVELIACSMSMDVSSLLLFTNWSSWLFYTLY